MTNVLEVWLFANHVGSLTLVGGRLNFCYVADWLKGPNAIALSASLPLQAEPFDDHRCRPFFAGLLPEGQMRRLIARQFHVSNQNDFALLDYLGGECAGAVTFLEPGQVFMNAPQGDNVHWLSDEAVVEILDELPRRPMLAGQDGLRLSLAGAQDKLPVVFDGDRIGLPKNGAPSTHILKPPIAGVEDSVNNEAFCMALAGAMQLNPARSTVWSVKNHTFLLVERYDRVVDQRGDMQRLHQEDFCQALSVVPEMKYQNEGGPNLAQCFDLVRRTTRPSAPQVLRLLDSVIFNALIGNHDAHAKNFSLLYTGQDPVIAPFYDILSTVVYPALSVKMAMKIGSKYKFSEVQARHWHQFAESAGLSKAQTRKRVMDLAQAIPRAARKLQGDSSQYFSENALVERIVRLIEQRCALTIDRLNAEAIEAWRAT